MATVFSYSTPKPGSKRAMDREENIFEEAKHPRSEQAIPLEQILVDMLRAALAWELQNGLSEDNMPSSLPLRTLSPLKNVSESDETDYERSI